MNDELLIGKKYKVTHQRRGEFVGKLSRISASYLDFVFISGEFTNNPKAKEIVSVQVAFCKIERIKRGKSNGK